MHQAVISVAYKVQIADVKTGSSRRTIDLDPRTIAVSEVVDLVAKPAGTVVHLRILPGSVSDYASAVGRATSVA